jgi:hypothetical protein
LLRLFVIKGTDESMKSQTKTGVVLIHFFSSRGLAGGFAEAAWAGFYGDPAATQATRLRYDLAVARPSGADFSQFRCA